jgi:hypothetical protein
MTTLTFLIFYRKMNVIAVVQTPTLQHNLANVLNKINGPPPMGAMAPSPATAPTNATAAVTAATPTLTMIRNGTKVTPTRFIFGGTVTKATGTNVAHHPLNRYMRNTTHQKCKAR